MRPTPLLFLLALVHFGLALGYATVSPWRTPGIAWGEYHRDLGAPDEIAHANYVRDLVQKRSWPVFDVHRAVEDASYEAHQPPLAYLVQGGSLALTGSPDVESSVARWAMRGIDSLVGALGVVASYFLALWATRRWKVALATAALVALLPMNAALSGAVSNDPLLITLCTMTLALGVRHREKPDRRLALGYAILAALAVWTKTTAILLLVPIPFFFREGKPRLLAGGMTLALVLPLFLHNRSLYGDPLATGVFAQAFPPDVDRAALLTPTGLLKWIYVLGRGSLETLIGVFGYMDIHLPKGLAWPLGVTLVATAVAGLPRLPRSTRPGLLIFTGLVIVAYLAFNLQYVQTQSRYLFPALAPFCLAAVLGFERLFKSRAPYAFGVVLLGLVAANVYAFTILPGEFASRIAALQR